MNADLYADFARSWAALFTVAYKSETWWMPWLARLLFTTDGFMTRYTTTVGRTVYFPSRAYEASDPARAFEVLAHELVHVADYGASPLGFRLRYAFPQILAPLALLALLAPLWSPMLLALLFVVALAPWPAPWRVEAERRGYAMSIAVRYWTGCPLPLSAEEHAHYVEAFTGWGYYRMSWSRAETEAWLDGVVRDVRSGAIAAGYPTVYKRVYGFLRSRDTTPILYAVEKV